MRNSTATKLSLLRSIYNNISLSSQLDLETCFSLLSPLFPGVKPRTLADMYNMTQSPSPAGRKINSAFSKYWTDVDRAYGKLCKKHNLDGDEDDWYFRRFSSGEDNVKKSQSDSENDDWYFKRFNLPDVDEKYHRGPHNSQAKPQYVRGRDWYFDGKERKGEYSYVNKNKIKSKKAEYQKGDFDCRFFDCLNPLSVFNGFELCGC